MLRVLGLRVWDLGFRVKGLSSLGLPRVPSP